MEIGTGGGSLLHTEYEKQSRFANIGEP